MPIKRKGFFGKLRQVPEIRTEEIEDGGDPEASCSLSPTGLEIPVIRADDAGAAIDDLSRGSPTSPSGIAVGAIYDDGSGESTTSPDSTTLIGGRERKVSLDIAAGPQSPSPSVDRLSVSFSPELGGDFAAETMADTNAVDSKVRFSKDNRSSLMTPDDEDDDDYSESLDAIMRRRESGHRRSFRRSPKRGSSPFGSDSESGGKGRRRSSTMTSLSCEETQISIEEPEMTEEQIFESIRLHKELIEQMNKQPWKLKKRLKIVRKAKAYVKKHEGELEQRLAQSKNTKDMMARYNLIFLRYWERLKREAANMAKNLIPWEMRIKRIESHFGSVVASYFVFLRWVFWINIVMSVFISCFVIIPEVLAGDRKNAGDRKEMMPDEEAKAFNLQTLWDFEGILKYSPIFYGYYTNTEKTREGYRLPLAYFMTLLGMYGYSFAAILRRMAENTRLNKQSDKDEDCTFTWKLFTGWDYMIGHSETADNKVASLIMGFKENILEEREKKKEELSWKIIGLRLLANILVIILLASSAYAVVLVVKRSQEPEANSGWWRQNEVTVIVSMIGIIYPNLFDVIGLLEHNHPRTQLQWQLARIMILYFMNLYTLIFSLFNKIDVMSEDLQEIRTNYSTVAPTTTTTILSLVGDSSTGIFSPDLNFVDKNQTTQPNDTFAVLLELLNLTIDYHFVDKWNASCLTVKVDCDTKEFLVPTSNSSVNSLMGMLNAIFLVSTLASTSSNITTPAVLTNFATPPSSSLTFLPTDTSASNLTSTTLPYLRDPTITARAQVGDHTVKRDWDYRGNPKQNRTFKGQLNDSTTPWIELDYYDKNFGSDDNTTSTSPSWSDDDIQMDEPYFSTPYPSFEDADYGYMGLTPNCCVAVICMDSGLITNLTLACDDAWPLSSPEPPSTTLSVATLPINDTLFTSTRNVTTESSVYVNESTTRENVTEMAAIDDIEYRKKLRKLCWETMFGQELVKLTIMDLVMTTISILITDFIRALFVRIMNHCWCWDLEKQFPGYGDFKIAENILHLVNNQGMIWMGMFFSPGIPGVNMIKIVILMYIRSWAVLTCNIPHETVFKASSSSNFYYSLLLMMLFLCTLPVGYAVVWLQPSWHCGPFSQYAKIYEILTSSLKSILPPFIIKAMDYAASPGIIIPLLVLLILIIYYLNSVANSLREANKDLKDQLRRERTEERRKVFQMADARHDPPNSASKWMVMKKILPVLPSKVKLLQVATQQLKHQAHSFELKPFQKEDGDKKAKKQISEDENSEAVLANAIKVNSVKLPNDKYIIGTHKSNKDSGKVAEKNAENEKTKEIRKAEAQENPESENAKEVNEGSNDEKETSKTSKPKEYEY